MTKSFDRKSSGKNQVYGPKKRRRRPAFIGPVWPPAGDPIFRPWVRPTGNFNRRPVPRINARELANILILARMFLGAPKQR